MTLLLAALVLPVLGGGAAVAAGRNGRLATLLGVVGCVSGALLGLAFSLSVLLGGAEPELSLPWPVPYGRFALGADALSAVFLLPAFALPALAAVYGVAYLRPYEAERRLGPPWLFFNLLGSSVALVLVARNSVLFLVAWEVMSLASYFLVVFEDERASVRRAGLTYLVATHVGTTFLLAFFVLLAERSGSFDLSAAGAAASPSSVLFALALVGFGTKAGVVPLHIWLPEAHPAAPSHVSAVMSGVMIKVGVYGILRSLLLVGPAPAAWGTTLVGLGVATGVVGALFAVSQTDLKRLLAYSSVENVGVILGGVGLGVWGAARGAPVVALLGFGGALFHALNHALFKGLLFLGAGAVRHATGTLEIDALGGLLRRMPRTGWCFLAGALAISALPPLNGFAGELLLYGSGLAAAAAFGPGEAAPALVLVAGLALTGGLAVIAFVKAFGIAFLGTPRSPAALDAHEAPATMTLPMVVLASACVLVGVVPAVGFALVEPAVELLAGTPEAGLAGAAPGPLLAGLPRAALLLAVLLAAAAGSRRAALRGREVREADTWGCGYPEDVPRGQYTGSSLVEPAAHFLAPLLPSRNVAVRLPRGLFPREASIRIGSPDVFQRRVYAPLFTWLRTTLARARVLQHGQIQWYLLYIFGTLVTLLVLELGFRR